MDYQILTYSCESGQVEDIILHLHGDHVFPPSVAGKRVCVFLQYIPQVFCNVQLIQLAVVLEAWKPLSTKKLKRDFRIEQGKEIKQH